MDGTAEIIVFSPYFNEIGGIETCTYNLCKQLGKKYDVLMVTKPNANKGQIKRIKKICRVSTEHREKYECKYMILNSIYASDRLECNVKEKTFGMIHADYKYLKEKGKLDYKVNHNIDEYISVSKQVQKAFKETYGIDSIVIYNILDDFKDIKKPKKSFHENYQILKLVSATRLSAEKGYNRMIKLAEELNKRSIPFEWKLFCQMFNNPPKQIKGLLYKKTKLDISQELAEADYGVQLSDTEGYSYFIHECQQLGTPTITTSFPSIFETPKNGHILDFDLFENGTKEDWDKVIKDILTIPKVEYKEMCTIKDWEKIMPKLEPRKGNFEYQEPIINVTCIFPFDDIEENIHRNVNDKWYCLESRATELKEKKLIKF